MGSNGRSLGFGRKEEDGQDASTFFYSAWDPAVLSQQHESLNSQATFAISHFFDCSQNPSPSNLGLLPLPKLASFGSGGLSELIGPYTVAYENASERSKETLAGCSSHGKKRKRRPETPIAKDPMPDERKSKGEAQPSVDSRVNADGEGAEPPKDSYIHVRARRGQATNSHSLAERVRREKISERMKTLQELVPGCSKITGKAVMLDEIINYVQSLQHQVEFLSMKLATVNPEINVDIEKVMYSRGFNHPMSSSSQTKGLYRGDMSPLPQTTMLFPHNNQPVFETDLQRFLQPGYDSSSFACNGKLKPEA